MSSIEVNALSSPECPRCGYDLRGTVATWREMCPMEGRCSECGLDFEWGDVFEPPPHPWLFEHHWRTRPIRSVVKTTLVTLRPVKFCRSVSITDPVRLRPVGLLMLCFIFAAFVGDWILWIHWSRSAGWPIGADWIDTTTHALRNVAWTWLQWQPGLAAWLLGMPIVFLLLPKTLRRAKVRPRHIVRIWLHALLSIGAIVALIVLIHAAWLVIAGEEAPLYFNPLYWHYGRAFDVVAPGALLGFIKEYLPPATLVAAAWLGYWWYAAFRHYLRLPHPAFTAVLLWIVTGLTIVTGLAVVRAYL